MENTHRSISIPDELYLALKAQLATEDTNVSAWVREMAREKLKEAMLRRIAEEGK